jgi:hypothetical protein
MFVAASDQRSRRQREEEIRKLRIHNAAIVTAVCTLCSCASLRSPSRARVQFDDAHQINAKLHAKIDRTRSTESANVADAAQYVQQLSARVAQLEVDAHFLRSSPSPTRLQSEMQRFRADEAAAMSAAQVCARYRS